MNLSLREVVIQEYKLELSSLEVTQLHNVLDYIRDIRYGWWEDFPILDQLYAAMDINGCDEK